MSHVQYEVGLERGLFVFDEAWRPMVRQVYIRYGEPNYRSRSGHLNAFPGAAAESVKERNVYFLQSAASVSAADMTEEILFDGPEEADPGASTGGGAPLIWNWIRRRSRRG